MSERHRKEADSYSLQIKELQAQVEPLKRQANELQAHVDSHREEIRIVSICYCLWSSYILHWEPSCLLAKCLQGLSPGHMMIVPLSHQCHI